MPYTTVRSTSSARHRGVIQLKRTFIRRYDPERNGATRQFEKVKYIIAFLYRSQTILRLLQQQLSFFCATMGMRAFIFLLEP